MSHVFADTFFFLALLNKTDEAHNLAVAFARTDSRPYLTTEWFLTEIGDAFSARGSRSQFLRLLELLNSDRQSLVVPATHELFERGVALYSLRLDKDWSLTDCISFVVMRERGITDALTGDHHFIQAGFNALLQP